jgi:hypothetical protein
VVVYNDCKARTLSPEDGDAPARKHPAVALAMALGAIAATRMADVGRRVASS